jgi:DNA-binding GntR family transcriptional regulator
VREHEKILAALEARDAARLRRLLEDHLAHKLASMPSALHKAA